jgi:hypothetical protein
MNCCGRQSDKLVYIRPLAVEKRRRRTDEKKRKGQTKRATTNRTLDTNRSNPETKPEERTTEVSVMEPEEIQ